MPSDIVDKNPKYFGFPWTRHEWVPRLHGFGRCSALKEPGEPND
jgi:hypothetical protein